MLINEESKESFLDLLKKTLNVKMIEAELKWADQGAKELKSRRIEIIKAFKQLDSFDTYIESNYESQENFELLIINEIKICIE